MARATESRARFTLAFRAVWPVMNPKAIVVRLCLVAMVLSILLDVILQLPSQSILLFLLISVFDIGCVGLAAIGLATVSRSGDE